MNIANLLVRTAQSHAGQPALAHGTETVATYREFANKAASLGAGLMQQYGLQKGDRVALIMKNHPEYWISLFAVWHAGLTAVPVNAKLHISEFTYILENSGAKLAIATPELAKELTEGQDLAPVLSISDANYADLKNAAPIPMVDMAPDDLAWLFYTSGTTGKPKGAMLSHRNLLCAILSYFADVSSHEPGDCIIHAAPQTHGSGLYGLPLIAKGGIQVTPLSGGFEPAETLELIAHHKNCCFFFAPTMVHRLIGAEEFKSADTSNIKLIVYGGGPMYEADIRKALDAIGPKFCQIYGQGEAPMTITVLTQHELATGGDHPNRSERLASVGVERTDVEVCIRREDGTPCDLDEIGEITVRGDVVMLGYWQNEEATNNTLKDGWLWTGDMGAKDQDGFITLKDRSKDLIISGGTNIYPREIEEVLLTHPDVAEVSVIGRHHADWGEEVIAFVVPNGDVPSIETLDAHCLEHMARFKRPKEYFIRESLPKNNYGKVLKTELRKEFEN
ncbi:AMP-binding protein [Sneathiella sp. P13V-1]|uniref:AMP-binding protein n=1 Tax=Sneathiella sp. P13V-1 TaxID=2697366 RepID=UPI00187B74F8|nr:AMP-binding protein [Sneathiella sp. P13V-1]MBE7635833.1 AMP-binding protein [Sneathiella sp. P13V-1]